MNTFRLLADTANKAFGNGMSIAERLQNGGKMILILMAFVFSVIFIIFFSQTVISAIINGMQKKAEKIATKDAATKPSVETEEAMVSSSVSDNSANDDDVTVAVITAALAAYLASTSPDGNVLPFKVVSFKRKNSGKPWNS